MLTAVIVCAQGCEDRRRHQILNFFFTGVPPLEKDKLPGPVEKPKPVQKVNKSVPAQVTRPVFYAHAPYANRSCNACHGGLTDVGGNAGGIRHAIGRQSNGTDAFPAGLLSTPIETLCIQCHDSMSAFRIGEADLWLHGPAAQGKCTLCHDPHQSKHPNHLTEKSETLCGQCHEGNFISETNGHSQSSECLNCHNPHLGKTRLLLKSDFREEAYSLLRTAS